MCCQRKSGNVNYQFYLGRRMVATGPRDETKRKKRMKRDRACPTYCRNGKCCKYCIYAATIQYPLTTSPICAYLIPRARYAQKVEKTLFCLKWKWFTLAWRERLVQVHFCIHFVPPKLCATALLKIWYIPLWTETLLKLKSFGNQFQTNVFPASV